MSPEKCFPERVCRCCVCNGIHCMLPHEGHSCKNPKPPEWVKPKGTADEWNAFTDPWLERFMDWKP